MDSVLEDSCLVASATSVSCFNPSFCGFGIGGSSARLADFLRIGFNPSFCGFGIGG